MNFFFLFSSLLQCFYLQICANDVNSILAFVVKGILSSSQLDVFLITVIYFRCTWVIPIRNSSKTAGFGRLCLWHFGGSGVLYGWFSVFCSLYFLLCERLFLENCPYWIPQCFKESFSFNFTYKEAFLKRTLPGWILIRLPYYISHLWNSAFVI